MNGSDSPSGIDATVGDTVTVNRTAGSTVIAAVPVTEPSTAMIVASPVPAAVARPCDPEVFETVATDVDEDDHVTVSVRFWVLRFE